MNFQVTNRLANSHLCSDYKSTNYDSIASNHHVYQRSEGSVTLDMMDKTSAIKLSEWKNANQEAGSTITERGA
jgi:hypothetical protein